MVFKVLNAMMKIWCYFYIVLSKQLIATWMSCVHEHMLISFNINLEVGELYIFTLVCDNHLHSLMLTYNTHHHTTIFIKRVIIRLLLYFRHHD